MTYPANRLAQESSPYLQQHAHNPVDWYPWGPEALQKAVSEDKLILVSIGYAACHWCHVMERESFESVQVAAVMNEHFICIKVDREERPDVDQVYMDALHAMGVQGGWPLHVFLTPAAKPFYGGTYFSPHNWVQLLSSIAHAYAGEHRGKLDISAEQFTSLLQASELEKYRLPIATSGLADDQFALLVYNLTAQFDRVQGGVRGAPKFPMSSLWLFLLQVYALTGNETKLAQFNLTLTKMACGGLYDQIGGGFARYATDEEWRIPHFEKMLYDNGQLLSLYSAAYQVTGNQQYQQVVYATIRFLKRELTSPEGGFYSSLDADSEKREGTYYVWTKEELQQVLGDEEPLASAYYNCTALGNWEHGENILHRHLTDEAFAQEHQLTAAVVRELVQEWQRRLLAAREARSKPALDDKVLTGWNALTLQGLLDAYKAFAEPDFLALALRNAAFLRAKLRTAHGGLYRTYKRGRATILAFLEDYALLIQAYISLYEATFTEEWLEQAEDLVTYVLGHFFDLEEPLFFYTDKDAEALIARKKELFDNVIPASNSIMAHNLHRLGLHLENHTYTELAATMLGQVQALVTQEPHKLSNWAMLYARLLRPTAEIVIVGPEAEEFRRELSQHYLPNAVLAGTATSSNLPLLKKRDARNGLTTLYVCFNHTCQKPVHSVAEALQQL